MFDSDKKQFAQLLRSTMLVCGGEAPEPDVLRIWWGSLQIHDIDTVSAAFSQYAMRGKYQPKPADILEIIDRIKPDGRVGADEAWAMIPRDESESAVMTQEMRSALAVAQNLLDEGDKIGARMAFKDAYNRVVAQNKAAGIAPEWQVSLGWDVGGRETVIREALRLGRLSTEHVESAGLLPDRSMTGIAATLITGVPLRLATVNGDAVDDSARRIDVKARLAGLRAAIGKRDAA